MSRRVLQGLLANQNQFKPFILKVKTDNAGTSASNQFTIPTYVGEVYNYTVKYDGQTLTNQTGDVTLTFPSGAGEYDVSISGTFSGIYFNDGGDKLKLLDVKNWGNVAFTRLDFAFFGCSNLQNSATDTITDGGITNLSSAWMNCSSATSFPEVNTLTNVTNLFQTWRGCTSATSFPDVNTLTNVTTLSRTWQYCSSATSFPDVNTLTNVTNLFQTWQYCSSATSFPEVNNLTNVTTLYSTWAGCTSATSFPEVNNLTNVTNLSSTWRLCSSATSFPEVNNLTLVNTLQETWRVCRSATSFPSVSNLINVTNVTQTWRSSGVTTFAANEFDNFIASNYTSAYVNTNLTQQSIDNILASIDTSGVTNGVFNQSGGSAPSAIGLTAMANLRAKGWSITVTGGY